MIYSDEHDAKYGVRDEPEQQALREPASKGGRLPDKPKKSSEECGYDRASFYSVNRQTRIAAPFRTLRVPAAHSHVLCTPALPELVIYSPDVDFNISYAKWNRTNFL